MRRGKFEDNPELEKSSYSLKEICELLQAINMYMEELGVVTDGDLDYENVLKQRERKEHPSQNYHCSTNA